jgi:hypothetical protein
MADQDKKEKPPLIQRVGKRFSFLNTIAFILVIVSVVVAILRH